MKPVHEEWKRKCFPNAKSTTRRHIKNRITIQSNEQNKVLENDLKQIRVLQIKMTHTHKNPGYIVYSLCDLGLGNSFLDMTPKA